AVDEAPVAHDGSAAGIAGVAINGTVSADDVDTAAASLRYGLLTQAAHGTLAFHADGSFIYTPEAGYSGPDSFTFKASDGSLDGNVATVSLSIDAVHAPTPPKVSANDFNGDGHSDILWQNADGTPAVWLIDGINTLSGANVGFNPGAAWHVIGAADFDGDGRSDILWQNADGTPAVWLMNGTNLLSGTDVGFNPGAAWHVV